MDVWGLHLGGGLSKPFTGRFDRWYGIANDNWLQIVESIRMPFSDHPPCDPGEGQITGASDATPNFNPSIFRTPINSTALHQFAMQMLV